MRHALTVAAKDLRIFVRDRTGMMLTFALPLVLVTIFGAAMGAMGGSKSLGKVRLLVEDLDASAKSSALVDALRRADGLNVEVTSDVRARVADGKAPAALRIPSGWGAGLEAGRASGLVLYRDPAQSIEQQIVAGNMMPALMSVAGKEIGRAMMRKSLKAFGIEGEAADEMEKTLSATLAEADAADATASGEPSGATSGDQDADPLRGMPRTLGLEVDDVTGPDHASETTAGQSHAVAGIAVMMLLFSLSACGGTILEEEAQGTLQRLRLTPTAGRSVLIGKALFTMVVGMASLVLLFAFGALVFHVPVATAPLALVVLSFAVAAAATSLGLVLAVTCRTRKQLEGTSTLVILAMSALGGSWFPLALTPAWYQKLGHFTLNAWAMDGYQGILWYGRDLRGVLPEIGVLLAIAAGLMLLALRGWRRRFEVTT